jgi:hypothetical protein
MERNAGLAADLLAGIARDLWAEANEVVPVVLDGQAADVAPPVRHFVETQRALYERATGRPMVPAVFQLPEPMLHPVDHPVVLVLGWNPGYSANERVPTLFAPVTEYIGFYRDRFGPHGRTGPRRQPAAWDQVSMRLTPIRHYSTVERLLERAGLGELALSETATYVDAIPWKRSQPSFRDPVIAELALTRIRRIVEVLQPELILTLGTNVAALIDAGHPRNPEARLGTIGDWEGLMVPMYHPASYGLLTKPYRDQVVAVIRDAVAPVTRRSGRTFHKSHANDHT